MSQTNMLGYNLNVMRQLACLVFNPIMIDTLPSLFAHQWVGHRLGPSLLCVAWPTGVQLVFSSDDHDIKLFILVGWGRSFIYFAWPTGVQLVFFFCSVLSYSSVSPRF